MNHVRTILALILGMCIVLTQDVRRNHLLLKNCSRNSE